MYKYLIIFIYFALNLGRSTQIIRVIIIVLGMEIYTYIFLCIVTFTKIQIDYSFNSMLSTRYTF